MIVKIKYHEIMSDHILATPQFDRSELVECDGLDDPKLISYIESKKDHYSNNFKKSKDKFLGFDYISHAGGVKVEEYVHPEIKKL